MSIVEAVERAICKSAVKGGSFEDAANAAIAAHKAALEAAGYRIVPVEATDAQIHSGNYAIVHDADVTQIYRAMLEAAPKETP